ncbi:hypothetical protein [Burkholderia gladioli]|uniref:hypothetical protein n=1 Tax=Burkholderia gladioli TaxID=28095 RepID=UPI000A79A079
MAKNSKDAYGAKGKGNLLDFDPDDLTLVVDESHPLYDERVHWPLDEAMVRNIDFQGVLQPIEVSKNPETGATEVVTGRQREELPRGESPTPRARGAAPVDPGLCTPDSTQRPQQETVSCYCKRERHSAAGNRDVACGEDGAQP